MTVRTYTGKTLLRGVFSLSLLLLSGAFFSCSNLLDKLSETETAASSERGVVTFSIANAADTSAERSVLPTSVDTSTLSFILSATVPTDSGFTEPSDLIAGIQYASISKLQEASFNLDAGEWTFNLKAYKNPDVYQAIDTDEESSTYRKYTYTGDYSSDYLVLTGSATVTVGAGSNAVVFEMEAAESGTGSVSVAITCDLGKGTCSTISNATGTLYATDGSSLGDDFTQGKTTYDASANTITYTHSSLAKGEYLLTIAITLSYGSGDAAGTTTSYYSTSVTVEPGTLSSETKTLSSLKQRYTITYYSVDSTTTDGVTTTTVSEFSYFAENATIPYEYNPNSKTQITLPAIDSVSRSDKCFIGWYDSYDESSGTFGNPVYNLTSSSTTGAKSYYAKWGDLYVYVSSSGNDTSGDGSSLSTAYLKLSTALSHIKSKSGELSWIIYVAGNVEAGDAISSTFPVSDLSIKGYGSSSTGDILSVSSGNVLTVSATAPVLLQNLTLKGGTGSAGAGLSVSSGATVTLDGVTITANNTQSSDSDSIERNGGGILNEGTLSLKDCTITANSASGYGGGIFNQGTLYVYGSTVIGGSAADDGLGNTAAKSGGGIDNDGSSTVYIGYSSYTSESEYTQAEFTGSISYNTATSTAGGGIYNQGTLIMNASDSASISYNTAPAGAGIYNTVGSSSTPGICTITGGSISNNTASSGAGGGIYSDGTLTVSSVTMSKNSATGDGGAIYATGALTITGSESSPVTINSNSAANGAGVYRNSSSRFTASYVAFSSNIATTSGGALYNESGDFTLSSCTFTSNTATAGSGGALYNASGDSTLSSCTFTSNTATSGNGGALYNASGTLTLSGGTIGASEAANSAVCGGGVYNAGTLSVDGTSICYNTASGSAAGGGGVYNSGTFTLTGSSAVISNNSATSGNGGGVYSVGTSETAATFTMNAGTVSANAAANGAGVYNGADSTFTMSAGDVSENTASTSGGGVYNAGSMFMYGSAIVGDSTARECATKDASSTITASNVVASGNGGGIYNAGNLYFGYSDADTTKDFTGGIYYNYAVNGGAIYSGDSNNLTIRAGTISYNLASSHGGAICTGGTFTFSGGTISLNIADAGGGVYNNGNMTMSSSAVIGDVNKKTSETAATEDDCSNTADQGGGVYINEIGRAHV